MINNLIRRFGAHIFLTVLFGFFAFLIYFSTMILPVPSFFGALVCNIGFIGCFGVFLILMGGDFQCIQDWINEVLGIE